MSWQGSGEDDPRQAELEREREIVRAFRDAQRQRDRERRRIPWWWPLVPQGVGLLGVVYEVIFDRLDRPWIMIGCVSLALGGKVADAVRDILR